jgi:hypothetical protein
MPKPSPKSLQDRCSTTPFPFLSKEDQAQLRWMWALGYPLELRAVGDNWWEIKRLDTDDWKRFDHHCYIRPVRKV